MRISEPKIPEKPHCGLRHFRRILKSDHSGRIFLLVAPATGIVRSGR